MFDSPDVKLRTIGVLNTAAPTLTIAVCDAAFSAYTVCSFFPTGPIRFIHIPFFEPLSLNSPAPHSSLVLPSRPSLQDLALQRREEVRQICSGLADRLTGAEYRRRLD